MSHQNIQLSKLLGIPTNAYAATLRMRVGKAPTITIHTFIEPTKSKETLCQRFELVPIGETKWIRCEDEMPKSGVPVIAFIPAFGGGTKSRRIRAQYAAAKTLEQAADADGGVYDEKTDTYYCEEGWYESNEYEEVHWAVSNKVTHWMPLPEAPETTA